jgi:hypothetical protein
MRTLFTLHLYLNDCISEAAKVDAKARDKGNDTEGHEGEEADGQSERADLVGGATSFFDFDTERQQLDVNCRFGRVLIFQHEGLLHSGEDVLAGTKYTMRTELLYELVSVESTD